MSSEKRSIVSRAAKSLAKALVSPADYQRVIQERQIQHEWETQRQRLQDAEELHELTQEATVANHELAMHNISLAKKEGVDLLTRQQVQMMTAMADQDIRKIVASGLEELKKLRLGGDVDIERIEAMGRLEILKGEADVQRRVQEARDMVKIKLEEETGKTKLQIDARLQAQEKLHELRERLRQNPSGNKPG